MKHSLLFVSSFFKARKWLFINNAKCQACLSPADLGKIVSTIDSLFLQLNSLKLISASLIKIGQILALRFSNVVIVAAAASKHSRAKLKSENYSYCRKPSFRQINESFELIFNAYKSRVLSKYFVKWRAYLSVLFFCKLKISSKFICFTKVFLRVKFQKEVLFDQRLFKKGVVENIDVAL